jgi:hypothetical protein
LVLTDSLPLELDLIDYSVSSTPPGLAWNVTVVTRTVLTGRPDIPQTVTSTVLLQIPAVGVNEVVNMIITARLNGLAYPAPRTIVNQVILQINTDEPSDPH